MPESNQFGQATSCMKKQCFDNNSKSEVLMLSQKSRGHSKMKKSEVALSGTAHWLAIMKSFTNANKETCRTVPKDLPETHRDQKKFPTGSAYAGTWNYLGMNGQGTYTFPHGGFQLVQDIECGFDILGAYDSPGVVYKGGFHDGMFHGEGELQYETGAVLKGKWNKGKLFERHLFFADGLEYDEVDWAYCRPFDRRFTIEYDEGLEPAGRSNLTADQPTVPIPPEFYDVGDGFYDPETKLVYKYNDLSAINRAPRKREQEWILMNCRKNPDVPIGPCPFLFEEWMEPSQELPDIPIPRMRTTEDKEEVVHYEDFQHHRVSRFSMDRGKLFTSRIGLCSKTAFYTPSKDGIVIEQKDISPANKYQKTSSVAFKESTPEVASTTVTVKAHQQSSDLAVSDWGLADYSITKRSVSASLQSGFSGMYTKDDMRIDIREDTSFKLPKDTSISAREVDHAKDSKIEVDERDIKVAGSEINAQLSFKMPLSILGLDQQTESTFDPEAKRSGTEAGQHKPSNIEVGRSKSKRQSFKMLESKPELNQPDSKEEATFDPNSKKSGTGGNQYKPSNIKIEKSGTQQQSALKIPESKSASNQPTSNKEEATLDPNTNKSETKPDQYNLNKVKIEKSETKQHSSSNMPVNTPNIDQQPDKEETTLNPLSKKSLTRAGQFKSSNLKVE